MLVQVVFASVFALAVWTVERHRDLLTSKKRFKQIHTSWHQILSNPWRKFFFYFLPFVVCTFHCVFCMLSHGRKFSHSVRKRVPENHFLNHQNPVTSNITTKFDILSEIELSKKNVWIWNDISDNKPLTSDSRLLFLSPCCVCSRAAICKEYKISFGPLCSCWKYYPCKIEPLQKKKTMKLGKM